VGADAGDAALVRAPLILAHAAPDAGVLAALDRPLQARFQYRTAPAYLFGFIDLEKGRPVFPIGKNSSGSASRQAAW
jgi:hypothetical protein